MIFNVDYDNVISSINRNIVECKVICECCYMVLEVLVLIET